MNISPDFVNKYSAQAGANEDSLGFGFRPDAFLAATTVDVGTSLFNSVVSLPKLFGVDTSEYNVDTYDILKSVNEDWASYYDQNKDLVQTASFIAGTLLPAGLAFKGMKLLQAGKLGFYPAALSDLSQERRISDLTKMLELGQKSTSDFRNMRWKILTASAGQEVMQAAGAEVAVLATLNQHPFMEDYFKDPVKNFGISMAIGGVLGTGISQIATRRLLSSRLGDVTSAATDKVLSKLIAMPLGISDVDKVQRLSINADMLKDIAANEENTPLVRQLAGDFADKWQGLAGKLEQTSVFGPTLKASKDVEALEQARQITLSDAAFGANRVDFLTYDPKNFIKQRGRVAALLSSDAKEAAENKFGNIKEIKELAFSAAEKIRVDLGGISHLGDEIERLARTALLNGESAARKQLNMRIANSSTFDNWDSTHLNELMDSIIKGTQSTKTQIEQMKKNNILYAAGRSMRLSLTASEGLNQFKPDWAELMKEEFRTHYSPFHKAWIPHEELPNYTRAVDTGKTTWEKVNVFKPNPDAFSEFSVRGVPTATADGYWLNTLGTTAAANLEPSIYMMEGDLGVQNGWLSRLAGLKEEGKPLPKIHLIPESAGGGTVSEMRKKATQITLEDLEENLISKKQEKIRALLDSGASTQEIGIRLNIPTDTLERMLMSGQPLKEAGNWRLYSHAGSIESEYMAQKTRTLTYSTNGERIASLDFRNADLSANLDSAAIKQQNRETMATIIAGGQSDVAKNLFEVLNADASIWDTFESQLSNIVNEKAGSFFFTSADFASRHMGDIGRIATIKGQEFFGVTNAVSQELLTNVATKLRTATQTQIGLNEFNRIVNLIQGKSGYVDIKPETGILFERIEQEPGVFVERPVTFADGTNLDMSPQLTDLLVALRPVSRELYNMKNVLNRIQGFKDLNDRGLWVPTFNPINKFLSYVIDTQATEGGRVKLLIGKSPEDLASLEQRWKAEHPNDTRYKLVTKAQQEDYNFWQMRTDPNEMDFADINKFHSGASASAIDTVDDTFANTLIENLHNRIIFYGRKFQETYLENIMSTLDQMSAVNQKYFAEQPTLIRAVGLSQREDAARSIKNVILGNNNLSQYSTWQSVNNGFASMIEWTSRKAQELYRGLFELKAKEGKLSKSDYVKFAKELEGVGIKNPFKNFNDYQGSIADRIKLEAGSKFDVYHGTVSTFGDEFKFSGLGPHFGTPEAAAERALAKQGEERIVGDAQVRPQTIFLKKNEKILDLTDIEAQSGRMVMIGLIQKDGELRDLGKRLEAKYKEITKDQPDPEHFAAGTGYYPSETEFDNYVRNELIKEGYGAIRYVNDVEDVGSTSFIPLKPKEQVRSPFDEGLIKGSFRAATDDLAAAAFQRRHNVPYATAEQIVAAGNSVLATLALRVMEVGHAVTTAISWPIMMLPEFSRAMPKTFLGTALGEGIEVPFPARAIYDGIRFRHSDMAKPLIERWIREGFGASIVSEATNLNNLIYSGGKGAINKINSILNSNLIKKLSTPSDFAESETRLWTLSIGYQLARRMYPGISDTGADLFAKEFMTKSVGNYYSAQRPAMFQGTFGVAIGLFQTYMLSFAQAAFRSIEEKNFKALAAQMLAQAGLFGMHSLPLYNTFSQTIGEHFSDKHYDLTTGTYRALPDSLAEFITYGLPASLGVGLYTRGDMQPRIPFAQDNPLDTIAAINATRQIIGATGHTLKKVFEANGMQDKFRGLLEGVAMQSLSRPMARIMEAVPLPDGQGGFRAVGGISRDGNTVATSADVWSVPGVLSRLVASRSASEQVKREVDYLNNFYGSIDYANRKSATEALKSAIRGGNLTQETLERTAAEYLRTGSATGWKAALNEALATSEGGIDYKLGKRLRPDSPFLKMIDQTY